MYRLVFIASIALSLSGCWLGAITSALSGSQSSGTQVNTEANLGKTNTKALSSTVQETTQEVENNNGEISSGKQQAQSINNTTGMRAWESILLWIGIAFVFVFIGGMMPQFDFMRRFTDGK